MPDTIRDNLSKPKYAAHRDDSVSPLPGATLLGSKKPIPVQMVDVDADGRSVITSLGTTEAPGSPSIEQAPEPEPDVVRPEAITKTLQASPAPVPVSVVSPASHTKPPKKRIKVAFTNNYIGRVSTFIESFAISDTIIVIAYHEDTDGITFEPPTCGLDNPVIIELDGNKYPCIYSQFSAVLDRRQVLVMIRVPKE